MYTVLEGIVLEPHFFSTASGASGVVGGVSDTSHPIPRR